MKLRYEQVTLQLKTDVQQINRLSNDTKFAYENNKQQVCFAHTLISISSSY